MTRPRLARLATDLLAEENPSGPATPLEAEERAVAKIQEAIRTRARRRTLIMRVGAGTVMAAALLLVVGYFRPKAPDVVRARTAPASSEVASEVGLATAAVVDASPGSLVFRSSASAPIEPQAPLRAGDRLLASSSGRVAFALADASRVVVDAESEVTLASLSSTRRFVLRRGALRADVTKLGPGERFIVETSDVEVEVHGTSFRVAVAPEPPPPPRGECIASASSVTVFEGIVTVRSHEVEARVSAGGSWPPPCVEPSVGAERAVVRSSAVPPLPSAPVLGAAAPSLAPMNTTAPAKSSQAREAPEQSRALAEQNALFAEATRARRNDDLAGAVAAYDRLLSKYPDAFLAESAAVERMRLLETLDAARCRAAAAAYLARYPNGFGRAEAQRLAGR